MDNIKVIIPRNEVVIVRDDKVMFTTLQEGETLVDVGNFNNCIKPLHNGIDFVDMETEEEKTIRLAKYTQQEVPLTTDQIIDVLDWCGVWPL